MIICLGSPSLSLCSCSNRNSHALLTVGCLGCLVNRVCLACLTLICLSVCLLAPLPFVLGPSIRTPQNDSATKAPFSRSGICGKRRDGKRKKGKRKSAGGEVKEAGNAHVRSVLGRTEAWHLNLVRALLPCANMVSPFQRAGLSQTIEVGKLSSETLQLLPKSNSPNTIEITAQTGYKFKPSESSQRSQPPAPINSWKSIAGARALGAKISNVGPILSHLPPDLAYVRPRLGHLEPCRSPLSPMLDWCLAYLEPSLDLG